MITTSPTIADAIADAIAAAKAAGLNVGPATHSHLGPTIHTGNLHMGFVFVGDEVEIVYCNSLTGTRNTRPGNAARITSAAAAFIAGATT